jgi:hypothetical protein
MIRTRQFQSTIQDPCNWSLFARKTERNRIKYNWGRRTPNSPDITVGNNQLFDQNNNAISKHTNPITVPGDPLGSETSRLPDILDNQLTDGGVVISLTLLSAVLYLQEDLLVLTSVWGRAHWSYYTVPTNYLWSGDKYVPHQLAAEINVQCSQQHTYHNREVSDNCGFYGSPFN